MKTFACLLALLVPAFAASAATTGIDTVVSGIPAGASEVVVAIDTVNAMPAPDYEEPAAAVQDPALAQQPAQGQRRGRRGRGGFGQAMAIVSPIFRTAVETKGANSLTVHTEVPAGVNYRVRVVAIKGDGFFPSVLAGGRASGVKVDTDQIASTPVLLTAPVLKLAADHPASVPAGSAYTLTGTIIDPGNFLGAKGRMRVWFSAGQPPAANYDGVQISTVNVTTKDDVVTFNFDLKAPKDPTTLYFQLGEVSPDFVRKDGTQAAFLVLPDISAGAQPLQLKVEAAKLSVAAK